MASQFPLEKKIKASKAVEKPYKLSDGKGSYVFLNNLGSKYFPHKFNVNKKTLAIGVCSDITLAKSLDIYLRARKQLKENVDPSLQKQHSISLFYYD